MGLGTWTFKNGDILGRVGQQDGTGNVDLPEFLLMMTLKHQAEFSLLYSSEPALANSLL